MWVHNEGIIARVQNLNFEDNTETIEKYELRAELAVANSNTMLQIFKSK